MVKTEKQYQPLNIEELNQLKLLYITDRGLSSG